MKEKQITVGILAHVDAGKTTLAESMLYLSGTIRNYGRVDHKNAFLDTYELEKERGITIFSKQAVFSLGENKVTLLDTPGHIDFSSEMERTLQVLDLAILVINGMEGIQAYVLTLWKLLKNYRIPVFLFVNKMDQSKLSKSSLLEELQKKLSENCVDFSEEKEDCFYENLSLCEESLMEEYLDTGTIVEQSMKIAIQNRSVFPVYFGSALKLEGVKELLFGVDRYHFDKKYQEEFKGLVYKVSRDKQGVRLTHLKILGGSLKTRMTISKETKGEIWEEKINQIRVYSGNRYEAIEEAISGSICAVTGLNYTYPGEWLGERKQQIQEIEYKPVLEPVLTYQIHVEEGYDIHRMYQNLRQLEEEDPQLQVMWKEETKELQIKVMGEVQLEVLKDMIEQRYHTSVTFGEGEIVYKETIETSSVGVGHFEPLKHYAEVHVLLEPTKRGSGITYGVNCREEVLDKNWKNLILTHLKEKVHLGVLTGSPITDMKITLIAGRGHQKHTEGGDFRQATYRSVRQGLKKADSILLEPYYAFTLEIPTDKLGRGLTDIQMMHGRFEAPLIEGDEAIIKGVAPVITIGGYQKDVRSYTGGKGRLTLNLKGYDECHNFEEVLKEKGYDSEKDVENPTGSVFCTHGSGFQVPWYEVEDYMHVSHELEYEVSDAKETYQEVVSPPSSPSYSEEELEEIFIRTYGPVKRRAFQKVGKKKDLEKSYDYKPKSNRGIQEEYLLVDGYNIIFAWEELKELSSVNLTAARDQLCEILCNYQGFKKNTVIVVFDAYKTQHYKSEIQKYKNISVVYTKKAETADQYIEKTVSHMVKDGQVTVATSDALEQMIIWGLGAMRLSAAGLLKEVERVKSQIQTEYLQPTKSLSHRVIKEEKEEFHESK